MKLGTATQQTNERFWYSIDFVQPLKTGDLPDLVTVAVEPAGLVIDGEGASGTRAKWRVSGGVGGVSYKVTITTDTVDGETFEDEVTYLIKEV